MPLQPPLAEAEEQRDLLIARLFGDLGRQGLDANHPFTAYGDKEEAPKPGRLKSLLSLGRPQVDKVGRAERGPAGCTLPHTVLRALALEHPAGLCRPPRRLSLRLARSQGMFSVAVTSSLRQTLQI